MDQFYDSAGAVKLLEKISSERRNTLAGGNQDAIQHMSDMSTEGLTIVETGHIRKTWRLCTTEDEHGVSDEVVFRIQGIITKNNLIPRNVMACPPKKIVYISQQADICGLGSTEFLNAIAKLEEVNEKFEEHFSGQNFVRLASAPSAVGPSFTASNRLFTAKNDAPTEQDNNFLFGVDPIGSLTKMKGTEFIHAPENMVRYFKWQSKVDDDRPTKYVETVPGAFRVGDLVEMQVSFVAFLGFHKEIRVTSRLQAITMLDNSYSKAATLARSVHRAMPVAQKAVRRKVGYMYDDNIEEEGRQAKKRAEAGRMSE
ncbi:hypothetical protein C8R43DRAFT_1133754 [Mycena crocata]|nr:hypothetical protein C8R43DRAFT_1133754 [Mycena crocata]